jgi:hypothetical protein
MGVDTWTGFLRIYLERYGLVMLSAMAHGQEVEHTDMDAQLPIKSHRDIT